ncbi:MAG: FAD:protein FMN transferase [Oscillospiraceae bacterium]|nr:FAD:protein FMN transferase [Oscillospiraceae bacterium]
MKKRLLLCFLALALLLSACNLLPDAGAKPQAVSEQSIWAMDTQMDLRLYGDSDGKLMAKLTALLNELDRSLSATNPDSALSALNCSGATTDPQLMQLAAEALTVSEQTGGALDVTLLPVSRAWGFTTEHKAVPEPDVLEALRERVGMDKLLLSAAGLELAEGTELDLGSVAKGWAADRCRGEMEKAGLSGILSLGGNIQTVGTKPDGSPWIVGVQDPNDTGRYSLTLRLMGARAVVSSGDYQRFFMENGVRYCHILDPKTLAPVQGSLRCVTVVADSGVRADALSTALYVLGRETGAALWRSLRDFEAIWQEADGSVWITPGLKEAVAEGSFEVIEP